ncbi:MAG: ferredoxin--nitrite reductase [Acidimicrobiia bacterium]
MITTSLSSDVAKEIDRFEESIKKYLAGHLDEEVFRPIRLTNGIYGIRQGNNLQMVRVKIPQGRLNPTQLETLGHIAEEYSRGFGHVTTRQNIQFHFVRLERCPDVMRLVNSVGLTTREACGDTVRNITGCPLAGTCPLENADISAWARAATDYFLRHPISQRLPRKFKISFSGCEKDCSAGTINDIGVIAVKDADGNLAFRLLVGGGLGTTPYPAKLLEEYTPPEDLILTMEAILRIFDRRGNRENKLRARMKWLVEQMGIEEFRNAVFDEREKLRSVVGERTPSGIPDSVLTASPETFGQLGPLGDSRVSENGSRIERFVKPTFENWRASNVVSQRQDGKFAAFVSLPIGDITAEQFRELADLCRQYGEGEVRATIRQNLVFRYLEEADLKPFYEELERIGLSNIEGERASDVVACPGADTCNLAITQSRGLAKAIRRELQESGLADLPGVKINISGCSNSCGQHHIADIGLMGFEKRLGGNSAPGAQLMLGGGVIEAGEVRFGKRSLKLAAKRAPKVVSAILASYAEQRLPGQTFKEWMAAKGVETIEREVEELGKLRPFEEAPDEYVDWDEDVQFQVKLGRGECAT